MYKKKRWLPQLAEGSTLATVAATERAAGSDIGRVSAVIDPYDGGFLVNGAKAFVTQAAAAGVYLFVGRGGRQTRAECGAASLRVQH